MDLHPNLLLDEQYNWQATPRRVRGQEELTHEQRHVAGLVGTLRSKRLPLLSTVSHSIPADDIEGVIGDLGKVANFMSSTEPCHYTLDRYNLLLKIFAGLFNIHRFEREAWMQARFLSGPINLSWFAEKDAQVRLVPPGLSLSAFPSALSLSSDLFL